MKALLATFGDAFDDVETYGENQPSEDYLEQLLSTDYFIALAALKDGEVVDAITAYALKKFEREPGRHADIPVFETDTLRQQRSSVSVRAPRRSTRRGTV